ETPGARLVAACRADATRAAETRAELGVPCEASLEALLDRPDVDAVCLCTPSGLHAEQAITAARAGKHVLVEKPMALEVADADAMIAACREAGVHLGVAFQRRTDPDLRELHAAIRAGELGRLVLGTASVPYFRAQSYYDSAAWRGTWSLDGGGALMNQGIHLVDLLLWLMGGEPQVVGASGGALDHDIEVEDSVAAALRFTGGTADGAVGALVATTAAAPGFPHRVEVYGTRGGAQIEGDGLVRWEGEAPRIRPRSVHAADAGSGGSATGLGHLGHRLLLEDFAAALREDREPLVSGEEGRRSLALVLAVYEAAGLGPGRPADVHSAKKAALKCP
ncbi:MAG: Gfo/Idh/MocA family oxidoreductase, partial [Acidobacteria bacterium]|nr:Gfo/Idh/MocA family oxidoreductase [Acidobacteriota bacterium]